MTGCSIVTNGISMTDKIVSQIQVIGHRGAAGLAPENTLPSFEMAIQRGLNWVEFDVCLTKDNFPVVFHDTWINRCSNGSGKISQLLLSELKCLDFGAWYSEKYKNEKILELNDLLVYLKKKRVNFNLEIKCHEGVRYQDLVQAVIEELQTQNISPDTIIVSSFNRNALNYFHKNCPDYPTAILLKEITDDWETWVHECNATSIHLDKDLISDELLNNLIGQQLQLRCFTVNDRAEANRLAEKSVFGVFTDYPNLYSV